MTAGTYDLSLVALSFVIAVAAAATFLDLAVRVTSASPSARALWIGVGSITLGCGMWATHFVAMAAFRLPFVAQYDTTLVAASCVVAIVSTAIALGVMANVRADRLALAVGSVIIGAGITAMHTTGLAAMQDALHDDLSRTLAFAALATLAAFFALRITFDARAREGRSGIAVRFGAAVLFGSAIAGMHFAALGAMAMPAHPAPAAEANGLLPAIVGVVVLAVVGALLASSIVDRRRNVARSRRATLSASDRPDAAALLQHALLPRSFPVVDGLDFSSAYLPGSRGENIGGDWFDAFPLDDGKIAVSIGDVAGGGLSAAVTMNAVRQSLRAAAYEDPDPAAVLFRANRLLVRSEGSTMVTAVFGIIDPVTLAFTYASAGHPPPLVAGNSGSIEALPGTGVPLGIFDDYQTQTERKLLDGGAMLVLYTDGLVKFSRDAIAGQAHLQRAIEIAHADPTADPARTIYETVVGTAPRSDDAALMTVRLAPTVGEFSLSLPAHGASASLARNALRRYIDGVALTAERRFDLLLCAGEAIGNAIEHAYFGRPPGEFRLRARTLDGVAIIEIEDDGTWRDARENDRGRGIPLMRSLMDGVEIGDRFGGTRVQLTMSLRRRAVSV